MATVIPGPLDHTLRQLAAALAYAPDGSLWTHKDSPTVYRVLTRSVLQIDGPDDMRVCVLYEPQHGHEVGPRLTWCRPLTEFVERFAPVAHPMDHR
jgi:hypothetical protein